MQLVSAVVSFTVLTLQGSLVLVLENAVDDRFFAGFHMHSAFSGVAAVSSQKVASVMNSRDFSRGDAEEGSQNSFFKDPQGPNSFFGAHKFVFPLNFK